MRMVILAFCLFVVLVSLSLVAWLRFMEVAQVITAPDPQEAVYADEE